MTTTVPARSDIDAAHKWDIESVFPTPEAWQKAVANIAPQLPQLTQYEGRIHEGAETALACMKQAENLFQQVERIYLYASMSYTVETNNQAAAAQMGQAATIYGKVMAAAAFIEPELLALGFETIAAWRSTTADLELYDQYFDQLQKRAAHVRSADVEEVLGRLADPFSTATATHGIFANSELKFKPAVDTNGNEIEITHGTLDALLMDPDPEIRRSAWENYADAHLAFKNTMANAMAAGVKQNVLLAQTRRYNSALEASLAEDYLPTEVFHNTINAFQENLPIWHRYWRLRKKALGVEKLNVYDIKAPLSGRKPVVSYQQSMDWINAGLAPLGNDYLQTMSDGVFNKRWVDVYPNKHKTAGAFSTGGYECPPFILMSFTDDIESLSTLTHELGHSMHTYYSYKHQPYIYSEYTIFAAEVASNFNQALVRKYLLDNNDDPYFQIAVLEEAMSNFHRYFFLMPTLARFELAIHEKIENGEPLSADDMIALLTSLFQEGYGEEVVIDHDRIGITWAMFHTHLYANFYVYKYTTGLAGAHALAHDILAGKEGMVDNYLNFLKAGSSMYALDALKMAGVDLSTPDPVNKTFQLLDEMVGRLETLLTQIEA